MNTAITNNWDNIVSTCKNFGINEDEMNSLLLYLLELDKDKKLYSDMILAESKGEFNYIFTKFIQLQKTWGDSMLYRMRKKFRIKDGITDDEYFPAFDSDNSKLLEIWDDMNEEDKDLINDSQDYGFHSTNGFHRYCVSKGFRDSNSKLGRRQRKEVRNRVERIRKEVLSKLEEKMYWK